MATTHSSSKERSEGPLGLARAIGRSDAELLQRRLQLAWHSAFNREPGDLEPDFESLKRYYDPVAQGHRLRTLLVSLPDSPESILALPEEHALWIGPKARLITPEGRAALAVLGRALLSPEDPVVLSAEHIGNAERRLLTLYRRWSRHRLEQVLSLMGGGDKRLQVPAIGVLFTLLVARATSAERAVARSSSDDSTSAFEAAIFSAAGAFVKVISPRTQWRLDKERLFRGWTIGEINRRVPGAIFSDERNVFITPQRADEIVGLAIREMAHRADAERAVKAFDALVRVFRQHLPALAAHDSAFERPTDTDLLRRRLIEGLTRLASDDASDL